MSKKETRPESDAHFLITVNCDGLHPDDIEELKRSLETSRYRFKVEVRSKVRTEDYPGLFVIGVNTTLLVRFSTSWMRGRTRRGGLNAVISAIDETLDNSSHDRNRRPRVIVGPNTEPVITTEEALRGRKRQSWNRADVLTAAALIVALLTLVAAFVIPEVRQLLHLEKKPQASKVEVQAAPKIQALQNPIEPTRPANPEPTNQQQKPTPHVKGNSNVAGNNVMGKNNVTGSANTTGPTAVAPNGIAIAGGNVTNPTVNNFAPPPPKPAVVNVCVGEPQNVGRGAGHDGNFRLILTLTTDSPVENPTYGFQFNGAILSKGSAASSPDMAVNIKEGVTTPTSFAFAIYQTWYPGQRMNVEVYSQDAVSFVDAVGKHSESFTVKNGGCNSSL